MRVLLLPICLAACATTTVSDPKGGPRGLRASEHIEVAARHDRQARERWTLADSAPMSAAGPDSRDAAAVPWFRSWRADADHERIASIHRSEAAHLEAAYDEACQGLSGVQISTSPLQRFAVNGWPTATGAILYLSLTAGPPDQLIAMIKCHRAYMMLAPADMDDCPLDVPGLALDARGASDGITVSLSVKDLSLVPELQRRVSHDLETGAGRHAN